MSALFPVFYSNLFTRHDTGPGHPENAGRLTAVVDYLKRAQKEASSKLHWAHHIEWIDPAPLAQTRDVLTHVCRVHDKTYVAALKHLAEQGGGALDSDTVVSPQSYEVALLAVAAWLAGVDRVWQEKSAAFVLARPPGHHAEGDRGMGFCLLSNAAIAARYALSLEGIERVAILDWDVHHGNGTQSLIEDDPRLKYCSFHQSPAYPGTGTTTETGTHHNILNLPLPPGSDVTDYQKLWHEKAVPFLAEFSPNLLIVSAGYDATAADPLAGMLLQPQDYSWFTKACRRLGAPLLFGLEGGYDYAALASSVAATIQAMVEPQ